MSPKLATLGEYNVTIMLNTSHNMEQKSLASPHYCCALDTLHTDRETEYSDTLQVNLCCKHGTRRSHRIIFKMKAKSRGKYGGWL